VCFVSPNQFSSLSTTGQEVWNYFCILLDPCDGKWRQAETWGLPLVGGGWGERPCPNSATAAYPVAVDCLGSNTQPFNWDALSYCRQDLSPCGIIETLFFQFEITVIKWIHEMRILSDWKRNSRKYVWKKLRMLRALYNSFDMWCIDSNAWQGCWMVKKIV